MQKYQIISKAGSGNFSDVYKARNRLTDQIVAIKEMKYSQDLQQLTYKQLQIISQLNHPNIIKAKQVIKHKKDVKVVFQYMEETLLELYQSSRLGINQNQIKCILFQAAFALDYLHTARIIHRDIKPENLLINRKLALIKLIDFGLAKEDYLASTDYVATRWYRAPENLLGMRNSSTSMDIFALGCVVAELFTLNPLFPGENTLDQLNKIVGILGTPTMQNWPQGYKQMKRKGINLPSRSPTNLKLIFPSASQDLIDLLQQMLQINPIRRITARQITEHSFFNNIQKFIPENIYKQVKKHRQQYQSKKARKISPLNYSPMRQTKFNYSTASLTTLSTPYSYQKSNFKQHASPAQNELANISYNSRISMEGNGKLLYPRDLSSDSKKQFPKHWQPRKTSIKQKFSSEIKGIHINNTNDKISHLNNNNQITNLSKNGSKHNSQANLVSHNSSIGNIMGIQGLSNNNTPSNQIKIQDNRQKDKNSRIRHYFSRDHFGPTSTTSLQKRSSHKTKFFDSKGDNRYVTKTLNDDLKFNHRNTGGSKNETSDSDIMKPSPRYPVKYFKQSNGPKIDQIERDRAERTQKNKQMERYEKYGRNLDVINRSHRNKSVGMSIQPRGYLDKNKTFNSKSYLNKPILNPGFRKDYI